MIAHPAVTVALWLGPLLVPLMAAAVVLLRERAAGWLLPVAALPALTIGAFGAPGPAPDLTWVLLEVDLAVDGVARLLLLVTGFVWTVAGASARGPTRGSPAFAALWLVTLAGNVGLILAADVVTLYTMFALMTFAAYGLVVHDRTPFALRAGRTYITLAVIGEVALLSGLVLAASAAGDSSVAAIRAAIPGAANQDLIVALLLIGFGVKAGLVPLHVWLPLAHPAAPVPASAVLSGAMIKAGLLGWLRVLPAGEAAFPDWSAILIGLGLTGALVGVAVGVLQTDAKVLLAYSSISQMGLMATAVGVGIGVPAAAPSAALAAAIYALHHGTAKAALFLGVGVHRTGTPRRTHRLLLVGMASAALSLAGAPLTGGWVAKQTLKDPVAALPDPAAGIVTATLSLAAVGTTILMLRLLWLLRLPTSEPSRGPRLVVPWSIATGGALVGTWLAPIVVAPGHRAPIPSIGTLWDGAWPVLLGVVAAVGWRHLAAARPRPAPMPRVPAGDLLVLIEAVLARADAMARRIATRLPNVREWVQTTSEVGYRRVRPGPGVDRIERWLTRWRTAGVLLLVIAAALLWTLAPGR